MVKMMVLMFIFFGVIFVFGSFILSRLFFLSNMKSVIFFRSR